MEKRDARLSKTERVDAPLAGAASDEKETRCEEKLRVCNATVAGAVSDANERSATKRKSRPFTRRSHFGEISDDCSVVNDGLHVEQVCCAGGGGRHGLR